MPAKIVVTAQKGGSRVALVGTSGKELLASEVFREPRAKGATVRALKGLLGEGVVVEDHTVTVARTARTNGAARAASDGGPAKAAAARPRRVRTAAVKPRAKRTPAKSTARATKARTTTGRRKRA